MRGGGQMGRNAGVNLLLHEFADEVQREELDLDLANYEKKKHRTLSLPNLKLIYVFVPDHLPCVELETPGLAKVRTTSLERLVFIYPESVRCVHTFFHCGRLSTFRNLECLIFTDRYDQRCPPLSYKILEDFIPTSLKKLKTIDFFYYDGYNEWTWGFIKELISNLLEQPDLKVFWMNVQMTDANLLTEYRNIMDSDECSIYYFQLKHCEKLKDKIYFVSRKDFFWSGERLKEAGIIPRSEEFLSKFFSIYSLREIAVYRRMNEEEEEVLLEFIARSPNLLSLKLKNNGMRQEFYDRMPETVQLNRIPLRLLAIGDSTNGSTNFEFLLKLRDLEEFKTNQKLAPELIPELLRLPMLFAVTSSFSRNRFKECSIRRMSANRFRLNGKPLSLQELLKRCGVDSPCMLM